MRAEGPADAVVRPGKDSPHLAYQAWFFQPGEISVTVTASPSLACVPGHAVRYATSIDDEAPETVTLVEMGDAVRRQSGSWSKWVEDNAQEGTSRHAVAGAGYHTLKIWMIDPGIVLQKIVVSSAPLPRSYLGPPETFHR
jgi:hypothetical protein